MRETAEVNAVVLHALNDIVMEADRPAAEINAVVAVGELTLANFPVVVVGIMEDLEFIAALRDEQGVGVEPGNVALIGRLGGRHERIVGTAGVGVKAVLIAPGPG